MNAKQKQLLYRAIVKLLVWKAVTGMSRNHASIDYKVHEAMELLCSCVDEGGPEPSFRTDVLELAGVELHNDVLSERPLDSVPF